ncbi:MAG: hypothetical protein J5I52_08005 [Saprospiraceae bacterium]|nr:MAG: hypothetical protein UZ09_BCD002002280 [Bacteroidetes bacterium OLB9]MCO6464078.1 hypothetical protein [Saprospiraceae bacterium]MCZ2337208.1 hypothetical protein [Chitinophagales bacterium]
MSDLDNIFRNRLKHHTVEIPDDAWERIAARLPEQKSNFIPALFVSSVAFITLAVIGFGFWWTHHSTNGKVAEFTPEFTQIVATVDSDHSSSDEVGQNVPSDNIVDKIYESSTFTHIKRKATFIPHNLSSADQSAIAIHNSDLVTGVTDKIQVSAGSDASAKVLISQPSAISVLSPLPIKDYHVLTESNLGSDIAIANQGMFEGTLNNKDKACPFNSAYNDKSLDVYYSNDYIFKQLKGDAEALKDMRTKTESPLYSFSAGIRFGYNIGYRWNLHTGINYSQINEKFEYTDPESNQVRIIIVKDYVYENGIIVDSVVRQEQVEVPGTKKHLVYNKYRNIDIPILARFTILANRYLSLSAVAGPYINVSSVKKGMIISDKTNKPVYISVPDNEGEAVYKNQVGVSLFGSLSLAYHLSPRIDFLLEPYAKLQTQPITLSTYPLEQKNNTFGLSTGLRYHF